MSNIDTTPRRWRAANRPALFPPHSTANYYDAAHWELVAINSKTATVRNRFIVGELGYEAHTVRVMDPAPYLAEDGTRTENETPGATWEPRTLADLRRDGVRLGVDARLPYDSGERAEPKLWATSSRADIMCTHGPDLAEALDRFGRVDFDTDGGETIATVYAERQADGSYVLNVYAHSPQGVTVRETSEDANADMRAAVEAFRDAAERSANLAANATDADELLAADYDHEKACREFAPVAARFLADRLGVSA